MFARLRHHAFIRRDNQGDHVNSMRARQHVLDETFMARHVDKANAHFAEVEIGKANVDRYAAPFFFWQTIGIDSGQGAHQRRLAVIDMPGRADNDRFHRVKS